MFKKSLNRTSIRLKITTAAPLLIRAGDTGLDPSRSDLSCVRTRYALFANKAVDPDFQGLTVYIPGSSFKGVIRSAGEAMLRGQRIKGFAGEPACDPLDHERGCNQHSNLKAKTSKIHALHCLACRTFGSTGLRGRASVRDLFPFLAGARAPDQNYLQANRTEVRNGIAIDRVAGSVRRGVLYDLEMIPTGCSFYGDIALSNFQAWQLGLLAIALQDLDDGFVQLGSTKTRGFGVVRAKVEQIVIEQSGRASSPQGVARLIKADEAARYKLLPEVDLLKPKAEEHRTRGFGQRFDFQGERAAELLRRAEVSLQELL